MPLSSRSLRIGVPVRRLVAAAVLTAVALAIAAAADPPTAQADNCQPEELVVRMVPGFGTWNSPVADAEDPRCYVAAGLGCPNQADQPACAQAIVDAALRTGDRHKKEWILICARDTGSLPEPRRTVEFAVCIVLGDATYQPGSSTG